MVRMTMVHTQTKAGVSVATTKLGFNTIEIIESVSAGDGWAGRTGHRLFDAIQPLGLTSNPSVDVRYTLLSTKDEFFKRLDWILQDAKTNGHKPVLHIEAHGGQDGLMVGSGESVPWPELRKHFTEINHITRVNLIVLLSACDGAQLIQLLQPHDRAPFRLLIGPRRIMKAGELEDGCTAFYRTLFRTADGIDAVDAMNAAIPARDEPFRMCRAEAAFHQIMVRCFADNRTSAGLDERLHRVMKRLRAEHPNSSVEQLALARGVAARRLMDFRWQHELILNKFFFLDEFPEDIDRYEEISYQECIDASLVVGPDE
jgi:hypothetical protein